MAHYAREEIMSSSEVVRNFGAILNSVVQHRCEKIAILRNNRLEAVLVAVDVYERMEKAVETAQAAVTDGRVENSSAVLDFLNNNRIASASRLSAEEINHQILEEREAWD
jgi:PHD/YefM family antitoxin component YafN of YafNO toxin-antitoxin module